MSPVDDRDFARVVSTPTQSNAGHVVLWGYLALQGSTWIDRTHPCYQWLGTSGTEPVQSQDVLGSHEAGRLPFQRSYGLEQRISQWVPEGGCSCSIDDGRWQLQ